MPLAPGDRLGPYELVRAVGEGGMGQVWEAIDPRMERGVAIKTLAPGMSRDLERVRRFQQEAKAAGALNHPHVLSVYDVGEEDLGGESVPYLVTELLDGETLADRLQSGQLPVRRALDILRQVAEGLAAAHEQGFVHRDLKPANIFLTPTDHVRILDFGLAKLMPDRQRTVAPGPPALTRTGALLGTLGYMSPEQVRGEEPDARSDVFAVGVILWEALAGTLLFPRTTPYVTMQAVLEREAPLLDQIRPEVSRELAEVVGTCLEKEPERRFQAARDLAFVLRALAAGGSASSHGRRTAWSRRGSSAERRGPWFRGGIRMRWLLGVFAAVAAIGLGVGLFLGMAGGLTDDPTTVTPPTLRHLTLARNDYAPTAAPDGSSIAFVSQRDGVPRVWLKELAGGGEAPLTDGPDDAPRFAPDGSSLLFVRWNDGEPQLMRQPFPGGDPVVLLRGVHGGDWSADGARIVWVRFVDDSGSAPTDPSTEIGVLYLEDGRSETLARLSGSVDQPRWSPDGRTIALADGNGFLLLPSEGGPPSRLQPPEPWRGRPLSSAAWDGPAHLVYLAASGPEPGVSITAAACLRQPTGDAARSLDDDSDDTATARKDDQEVEILFQTANWGQHLDLLPTGGAVYAAGFSRQSLWLEPLAGESPGSRPDLARPLTDGASIDRQPVVAGRGRTVVFTSDRSGNLDLWRVAVVDRQLTRLTDHPATDWDPALTADDEHLVWSSDRSGNFEIWTALSAGSGPRRLTETGRWAANPAPSPEGRWVVFQAGGDLWIVPFEADRSEPRPVVRGPAGLPHFSPDGDRLVYLGTAADRGPTLYVLDWTAEGPEPEPVASIPVGRPSRTDPFQPGRSAWLPTGELAVLDHGPSGTPALFLRRLPDGAVARILLSPQDGQVPETFDLASDGSFAVVSRLDLHQHLMLAEGLRTVDILRPD